MFRALKMCAHLQSSAAVGSLIRQEKETILKGCYPVCGGGYKDMSVAGKREPVGTDPADNNQIEQHAGRAETKRTGRESVTGEVL